MICLFNDRESMNENFLSLSKECNFVFGREVYRIIALNWKRMINNEGRLMIQISPYCTILLGVLEKALSNKRKKINI